MKLSVHKGSLKGTVQAPPSKSHTHRAYMLAALSSGISHIKSPLFGEDTNATLDAVKMLGAEVTVNGDEVTISGGNLHAADNIIDCKNSGSSIRMLAGIAAGLTGKTSFTGDASLCKRPMLPLLDALKELGAEVESENGCAPFSVTGRALGTEVSIRGDISSQFISALLLGAPMSPSGVKIHLTTPLASRPYVNITISAMKAHGVFVEETEDGFFVPGNQQYKPADGFVSGDYSSAAFILAAGALTGKVTVTGLDENDPQGDKAVLDILSRFGARVSRNGDAVTVERDTLNGIDVDLSDAPDLFPIIAVVGCAAKGITRLFGAAHLAFKESNRLETTAAFLRKMGADIEATNDGCIIRGGLTLHGAEIETLGDHRIAMAGAIAGLIADGETVIDDISCADVSYPAFVLDLKKLGGNTE